MVDPSSADRIVQYYGRGIEVPRLSQAEGKLERARTLEIIGRHLSPSVRDVADVGGGPGDYALWLAHRGLRVHLVDLTPLHVELVRQRCADEGVALAHLAVGDALALALPDAAFDLVLLLGPLYHLLERADRVRALREARRIARPGAPVLCAAISHHASLLAGYTLGLVNDPYYLAMVDEDLRSGRHLNPEERDYFTDAFLHTPEELEGELAEAGLAHEGTLAVEGFAWLLKDFEQIWADPARRELLTEHVRRTERDRSVLGMSAHLVAVGRRPAG